MNDIRIRRNKIDIKVGDRLLCLSDANLGIIKGIIYIVENIYESHFTIQGNISTWTYPLSILNVFKNISSEEVSLKMLTKKFTKL